MRALTLFARIGGSAPGRWVFSRIVCARAPYFASIAPSVEALVPGRCVVRLRDRRRVRNHLGTVHAIALCNAAELAAGLATDAAVDPALRWIPKSMQVDYRAAARGTLLAVAQAPAIVPEEAGVTCPVRVEVRDAGDNLVFTATVSMWITQRRRTA